MTCYLSLEKDTLKETEKESNELAIKESGNDGKKRLSYNLKFDIDEFYFDEEKDSIFMCGSLMNDGKMLGFISIEETISLKMALDIIQAYIKKLNKLKTVLEATK